MGMWDFKPWDNDGAADWFGDFMDNTEFRKHWIEGINQNPIDDPDEVRAAASLFVMLGRVYVWPIDQYDDDLELAIRQLKKTMESEKYKELPELIELILSEVHELESRQEKTESEPGASSKPWWKIW